MSEASAVETPAPVSLSERLQQITATLAVTDDTQGDVVQTVLTPAIAALNALTDAVLMVDATAQQLQLRNAELDVQTQSLDAFMAYSEAVGSQSDVFALAQHAFSLLDLRFPTFSCGYYTLEADVWKLQVHTEDLYDTPELLAGLRAGLPKETPALAEVLRSQQPVFTDAWDPGREQIENSAAYGTGASYPLLQAGTVEAVLAIGLKAQSHWSQRDRAVFMAVGHGLALALERAEQTRQLEDERAGLAAFVKFTEAVGVGSDALTLVKQAVVVLQATLPSLSVGYYERVGEYWVARAWSEDVPAEVVARMQAGVPAEAPDFARAVETGLAVFADHWDAPANDLSEATMYGAAAFLPLAAVGHIRHMLSVAIRTGFIWSERERGIVRAVASSLRLALERVEAAEAVRQQRDEAESRARALEAFEQLSRDLVRATDRSALIRRAQEIVLSLLPSSFAVYYELQDGRWRIRAQVGELYPELQATLDRGLPFEAPSAYTPWATGTPLYQDVYIHGSDTPPEVSGPVKATFSALLRIEGERVGIFSIGLFEQRNWSPIDRTVLSTALQSLELALERAVVAERLIRQNAELDARTEALEAFARFTEASTRVTDVLALAEQAKDVLRTTLGDLSVGYYELADGMWKAKVLSEDILPATAQTARAGFPFDVPSYARPFQERGVVFTDAWDAELERATNTERYGTGAFYPYFDGDAPYSLFIMGTAQASTWTERERNVFLSISRSLGLALERAYSVRRMQLQSAEVESRNRALEAFSTLTGVLDVRLDRYELIRRTQELVRSLLPPGYAAYFEPEDGLWMSKVQVGDAGLPALQAAIDAGFPVGATPTLDAGMNTGEPYFVEVYAKDTDIDPEVVAHLNAVACLPVYVRNKFVGIFNFPLFETRVWMPPTGPS